MNDINDLNLLPVTEQVWAQDTDIVVSVSCATYNHEPYIRACIVGFLMQRTSFPIEILIHDDASTDRTAAIVAEFAVRYPGLIKPIYQTENQYSRGVKVARVYNTNRAKGEFMALCEGDDYWTDPYKLENHVRFLRNNLEYSLVADNSIVLDTIHSRSYPFNKIAECDPTIEQLLVDRIFGTAATMYRRELTMENGGILPVSGDIGLWCYLATKGKIRYIPIVTSVYRRGLQGVVLGSHPYEWATKSEKWNCQLRTFLKDPAYHEILRDRNFNVFWASFIYGLKKREMVTISSSFYRCLYYRPIHFFLRLSNIAFGKFQLPNKKLLTCI